MAEVEKAVANMDSKEIEGRRLRVRGSKVLSKVALFYENEILLGWGWFW